jgi:hypothetical protein
MFIDGLDNADNVIVKLGKEDMASVLGILDDEVLSRRLRRKALRAHNRSVANQILFWDDMVSKYERCETAVDRDKIVVICQDKERNLYLVERPASEYDDVKHWGLTIDKDALLDDDDDDDDVADL